MHSMKRLGIALSLLLLVTSCKRHETVAAVAKQPAPTPQQPQRAAETQRTQGTEVGSTMPEYSALGLDGSKFDLASKRDKVVLLNLWATWCGPCRYEIPELQAMTQKYGPRGFEVVGVSVDESGAEVVKQFVTDQKITYPIVLDPDGKLATIFQTSVLPTSVVIDRKGQIVWKKFGAIEQGDRELTTVIEKSL